MTQSPHAPNTSKALHMNRWTHKTVLMIHIISAGSWIGIDIVMGVFVFTSMLTDDENTKAICYQALELFAVWPLIIVGVTALVSGVLLGLGTKYGLVRYWWVAIKLVVNIVLLVLVVFLLRTGVAELAEQGRHLAEGGKVAGVGDMLYPPIVSTTALVGATILAVYKPWGRLRRR